MVVSTELYLIPRRRPGAAAILNWYEKSFRSRGLGVERLPDDQLEFTVPLGADADGSGWESSLGVVIGGTISVSPTEIGFRVSADVQPRIWIYAVPILSLMLMSGGVALSEPPLSYLLALGGLPFVGVSWIFCNSKVRGVLEETNNAIEDSYNSMAPATDRPTLPRPQ